MYGYDLAPRRKKCTAEKLSPPYVSRQPINLVVHSRTHNGFDTDDQEMIFLEQQKRCVARRRRLHSAGLHG